MNGPSIGLRRGRASRSGFTLVELLTVLLIVSVVAAIALPVVIPAISHRQVSDTARIIQGGLVAARDAALRTNTPHGIRLLPDPTHNGVDPAAPGVINKYRTLASNRFIPIEQPPGYSEGKLFVDLLNSLGSGFSFAPPLGNPLVSSTDVYPNKRVRMVVQSVYREVDTAAGTIYQLEAPTSWYWNIRVGDKLQINDIGPYYTVVGPVDVPNPEMFVNLRSGAFSLVHPSGSGSYSPEILFLVNGQDDDQDGYVDNGWDGVDNNGNGLVDEAVEWSETERWPSGFSTAGADVIGSSTQGVSYTIVRRPAPSPGSRETALPSNVVIDLTSSLLSQERSRLPVDEMSGVVDIVIDPSGRLVPTSIYSGPASLGMHSSFYHIWVAERSDLAEVVPSATELAGAPLLASPAPVFRLPMTSDAYDAYDPSLIYNNPTLPTLKGEMRLLTIATRTGNLITTDRPRFDVTNINRPYHDAQLGRQGDTP